ncbi:MAG TPA: hypothetical protein VJO13_20900 [Ktedonobacterales bacterium]|nr:hypothetical protein [Ktedonobacterales bacterium]
MVARQRDDVVVEFRALGQQFAIPSRLFGIRMTECPCLPMFDQHGGELERVLLIASP